MSQKKLMLVTLFNEGRNLGVKLLVLTQKFTGIRFTAPKPKKQIRINEPTNCVMMRRKPAITLSQQSNNEKAWKSGSKLVTERARLLQPM